MSALARPRRKSSRTVTISVVAIIPLCAGEVKGNGSYLGYGCRLPSALAPDHKPAPHPRSCVPLEALASNPYTGARRNSAPTGSPKATHSTVSATATPVRSPRIRR